MGARLYGRSIGNGSLAYVTAGFRMALEEQGLLKGFVGIDTTSGSEEQEGPPGALARDGIFTGNLNHLHIMRAGARHERHWVTVTPNSTYVPRKLLGEIVRLPNPHILSASRWGTGVIINELREMGFRTSLGTDHGLRVLYNDGLEQPLSVTVMTAPHGVHGFAPVVPELERARTDFEKGKFRVIHFSTSDGERKGTVELLQAWNRVMAERRLPQEAELLLVLDHHAAAAMQSRCADIAGMTWPHSARVLPRADLNPMQMSRVLCSMHLIAAPSRGEGFGLLPLQGRICGVPSIATTSTGHSEHCLNASGIFEIQQPQTLESIDDGPGARARPLDERDVANALSGAYDSWLRLSDEVQRDAAHTAKEWSWQRQLAGLVRGLQ